VNQKQYTIKTFQFGKFLGDGVGVDFGALLIEGICQWVANEAQLYQVTQVRLE